MEDSFEKRGQLAPLGFDSRHLGGEFIALLPSLDQIGPERAILLIGARQIGGQLRLPGLGLGELSCGQRLAPGREVRRHLLGAGGLLLLLQALRKKNLD